MKPEYLALLGMGFLSSAHCLGMCGPLVFAFSSHRSSRTAVPDSELVRTLRIVFLNSGRILTYVLMGVAAGGVGIALDSAGNLLGIQRLTAFFAGLGMVLFGLVYLGYLKGLHTRLSKIPFPHRWTQSAAKNIHGQNGWTGVFMAGLVWGTIPCMLTWTLLLQSAGTGNFFEGGLTMLLFGLGTLPAMALTGAGADWLAGRVRRLGVRAASVGLIILGSVMMARALMVTFHQSETGNHLLFCIFP